MKYKDYNPDQVMLLPPSVQDLIPRNSPMWFIMDVINSSLLQGFETSKSEEGNSAYNPLMMVRFLVLGYYYGITSSRELQRKACTDIEFMYITGWQHPDFRTICKFRKNYGDFLGKIYKKVYRVAREAGLANLGSISIDGTIIKADASGNRSKSVSKWKEIEKSLDRKIKAYHKDCALTDKSEDDRLGGDNDGGLPRELQDDRKLLKKIRSALRQISEEDAQADVRVNISDPDARFMKKSTGGKSILGYRIGAAVDENQLVADIQMTDHQSDMPLLGECLDGVKETLGGSIPENTRVLADKGFSSAKNTQLLEDKNLDGYISQAGEFNVLCGNKYKKRHDCPFFLNRDYFLEIFGCKEKPQKKSKKQSKEKSRKKSQNKSLNKSQERALKKISFAHSISLFPCLPINFFWNFVDFQLNIKFDYDEKRNILTCPMGRELHTDGKIHTRNRKVGKRKKKYDEISYKAVLSCKGCPLKKMCTPKKNYRVCKRPVGFPSLNRMRKKMEKPESRDVYVKRRSTVEPVFGDIKRNMGFQSFTVRGFLGKVELGLVALCHNVKKLFKMPKIKNVIWNYSVS